VNRTIRPPAVFFAVLLICLAAASGFALDFGAVLSVEPEYHAGAGEETLSLTENLRPWLYLSPGENMNLYLSLRLSLNSTWEKDEGWEHLPLLFEPERTAFTWRPRPVLFLELGRQHLSDATGLVLAGLFDGLRADLALGKVRLGLGAYYTGLLSKSSARIIMTSGDQQNYLKKLDYTDGTSYFASRRVLAIINGEFPGLSPRTSLAFAGIAQFDVNDKDATTGSAAGPLHSQYLEARYSFAPLDTLSLDAAVILGLTEAAHTTLSFAADANAGWEVPGALTDLFSLGLRWSSGAVTDTIRPFMPISGIPQGTAFTPRLSALMSLKAAYSARLHESLSLGAGFTYFFKTDGETVIDSELDMASGARVLGPELSGSLVWALDSAARFSAEAGIFFPQSPAFVSGAAKRWKLGLSAAVSF
jgi:hypothetical protein